MPVEIKVLAGGEVLASGTIVPPQILDNNEKKKKEIKIMNVMIKNITIGSFYFITFY